MTAVPLVLLLVAAVLWLPLLAIAVIFALVVGLGAWEWSRLAGLQHLLWRLLYTSVLLALLGVLYVYCDIAGEPGIEQVQPVLGLACLWWSIALLCIQGYPGSAIFWGSLPMRAMLGLASLAPAWLAAVYLLTLPFGRLLMLVLVLVVAAADVGAYFSGRAWGRHALAPRVSPAKTWEGFWGGLFCALLIALGVWRVLPPVQAGHIGFANVLAVIAFTALASVVGDLVESMVKRHSGVKDSGSLLPGHGGVLDRLDSLSAAAPVFALGLILAQW